MPSVYYYIASAAGPLFIVLSIWSWNVCRRGRSWLDLVISMWILFSLSWAALWLSPVLGVMMALVAAATLFLGGIVFFIGSRCISERVPSNWKEVFKTNGALVTRLQKFLKMEKEAWLPEGLLSGFSRPRYSLEKMLLYSMMWISLGITALVFLGFIVSISVGSGIESVSLRAIGAFSFTIFSVTLFPAVVASLGVLKLLSIFGILPYRVNFLGISYTMAGWSGAGGAGSLGIGLLYFALNKTLETSRVAVAEDVYPFDALIVYPVIGISLGFILGSVHHLLLSTSESPNHIVGALTPPALLTIWASVLAYCDFTPRSNAAYLLNRVTLSDEWNTAQNKYNGDLILQLVLGRPMEFVKMAQDAGGMPNILLPSTGVYLGGLGVLTLILSYNIHRKSISRSLSGKCEI